LTEVQYERKFPLKWKAKHFAVLVCFKQNRK